MVGTQLFFFSESLQQFLLKIQSRRDGGRV